MAQAPPESVLTAPCSLIFLPSSSANVVLLGWGGGCDWHCGTPELPLARASVGGNCSPVLPPKPPKPAQVLPAISHSRAAPHSCLTAMAGTLCRRGHGDCDSPTAQGDPVPLGKQRAAWEQKQNVPCRNKQLITTMARHHACIPLLIWQYCARQGQVALDGEKV